MFYTYIIQSQKNRKYYIGSTSDVAKRLYNHNEGLSGYTAKYRPYELKYFESFETRSEALKREREIKGYKGGNNFKKLIRK